MSVTVEHLNKPTCPCCNGNGMHYLYAVAAGAVSPDDKDAECSLCAGSGKSWFESRPNNCSAYRDLHRMHR